MGLRGPAPMTAAQLRLRGSWRARVREQNEVTLPCEAPDPPADLAGPALAEWHRATAALLEMGTLASIDRTMLAAWATTSATYEQLAGQLTTTTDTAERLRLSRECRSLASTLTTLAGQLGFSPAARQRMKAPAAPVAPVGGMGKFQRRRPTPELADYGIG